MENTDETEEDEHNNERIGLRKVECLVVTIVVLQATATRIAQVQIVCLAGELVVQYLVGLVDLPASLIVLLEECSGVLLLGSIRVILNRQSAKGLLNFLLGCVSRIGYSLTA